jgi:ABC-type antimicrobial peptide transport system permease subunit
MEKIQKKIFISAEGDFRKSFGKENTNSLFVGIISGFVVSIFLLSLEILKEIFKFLNWERYIIILYIIFLIMLISSIKPFSKYFLGAKL